MSYHHHNDEDEDTHQKLITLGFYRFIQHLIGNKEQYIKAKKRGNIKPKGRKGDEGRGRKAYMNPNSRFDSAQEYGGRDSEREMSRSTRHSRPGLGPTWRSFWPAWASTGSSPSQPQPHPPVGASAGTPRARHPSDLPHQHLRQPSVTRPRCPFRTPSDTPRSCSKAHGSPVSRAEHSANEQTLYQDLNCISQAESNTLESYLGIVWGSKPS